MLLTLFRTNQASASLLLFGYALALQLPFFLLEGGPAPTLTTAGYLGTGWTAFFAERPLWGWVLAAASLTVVGTTINLYAARHRMMRSPTQFPGLFVILCWALIPASHYFHPLQLGLVCLGFALVAVGRTYKQQEPAVALFNTGLWLGLGSLFHPELLLLLPAIVAVIGILRTPDPRSLLQVGIGILLVFFLAGTWAYYRGHLGFFLEAQFGSFGRYELLPAGRYSLAGLALSGLLILFVLASSGSIRRLLNIQGSKSVAILFWLLLGSLPVVALGGNTPVAEAQLLALPLGALVGLRMGEISAAAAELTHLLLFVASLAACVLALLG